MPSNNHKVKKLIDLAREYVKTPECHYGALLILISSQMLHKMDELNITKHELAEKANISMRKLNKILEGEEDISMSLLVKICCILNSEIEFYIT